MVSGSLTEMIFKSGRRILTRLYQFVIFVHHRPSSGQATEKGALEYVYQEDRLLNDQTRGAYRYHPSSDTIFI